MDTNVQKYLAFVKAVELGSFTKAAEALFYTQSGVSRMICDLEREWGVTLLERDKGGVRLTGDGEKLLPQAREVCAAYEKLRARVDDIRGVRSGIIRISTFSSVATHWIPPVIAAFTKDYPAIEIKLVLGDYGEIESAIEDGSVDFGFLRLPTRPRLRTVFLEQDELLGVLPPDSPLAAKPALSVADLCSEPFIMLEKNSRSDVKEIFERGGVTPDVRFTTLDDYAVMAMVERGLGVSVLPELILRRCPYNIVKKRFSSPQYRKIGLAFDPDRTLPVAAKRFLDYLDLRNE